LTSDREPVGADVNRLPRPVRARRSAGARAGLEHGSGATETTGGDALPHGPDKTVLVRAIFDTIAPRYDLVNRVITLGLDRRWRRLTVDALGLPAGSRVLDLACGTGDLAALAQRAGLRALGADLSSGMLAARHPGVPAVQADATALPLPEGTVDGVVCGFALRNFADLFGSLREAARVLRPGGRLALLEVATPERPLLRAGFALWFGRCVPALGGLLSDRPAYRYLPRSTAYLPAPSELQALVERSGFSGVGRRLLHGGLSQLITATRRGMPPGSR
jgi:demethylmenaquinone methyltransferase/2-methoxy-6-polyprenyl-1,4-benzoquinol methylase